MTIGINRCTSSTTLLPVKGQLIYSVPLGVQASPSTFFFLSIYIYIYIYLSIYYMSCNDRLRVHQLPRTSSLALRRAHSATARRARSRRPTRFRVASTRMTAAWPGSSPVSPKVVRCGCMRIEEHSALDRPPPCRMPGGDHGTHRHAGRWRVPGRCLHARRQPPAVRRRAR